MSRRTGPPANPLMTAQLALKDSPMLAKMSTNVNYTKAKVDAIHSQGLAAAKAQAKHQAITLDGQREGRVHYNSLYGAL